MKLFILLAIVFLQTNISAQKRDCDNIYGYWESYNMVLPFSPVVYDTIPAKWSFNRDRTVSDTYNIKQFEINNDCTKFWFDNKEFDIIRLSKDTLVISRYIIHESETYWCKRIGKDSFEKDTEFCDELVEVLNHKKIQDYLHPDIPLRNQLYIISNEYCRLNTTIGNIHFKMINEEIFNLYRGYINNFIKITSMKEDNQGQEIGLSYPIEGVSFVVKIDKDGEIKNVKVIEQ
jgi:hypothetical protein